MLSALTIDCIFVIFNYTSWYWSVVYFCQNVSMTEFKNVEWVEKVISIKLGKKSELLLKWYI